MSTSCLPLLFEYCWVDFDLFYDFFKLLLEIVKDLPIRPKETLFTFNFYLRLTLVICLYLIGFGSDNYSLLNVTSLFLE